MIINDHEEGKNGSCKNLMCLGKRNVITIIGEKSRNKTLKRK